MEYNSVNTKLLLNGVEVEGIAEDENLELSNNYVPVDFTIGGEVFNIKVKQKDLEYITKNFTQEI